MHNLHHQDSRRMCYGSHRLFNHHGIYFMNYFIIIYLIILGTEILCNAWSEESFHYKMHLDNKKIRFMILFSHGVDWKWQAAGSEHNGEGKSWREIPWKAPLSFNHPTPPHVQARAATVIDNLLSIHTMRNCTKHKYCHNGGGGVDKKPLTPHLPPLTQCRFINTPIPLSLVGWETIYKQELLVSACSRTWDPVAPVTPTQLGQGTLMGPNLLLFWLLGITRTSMPPQCYRDLLSL